MNTLFLSLLLAGPQVPPQVPPKALPQAQLKAPPQVPPQAVQTGPVTDKRANRPDPARCLTVVEGNGVKAAAPGLGRMDLGNVDAVSTPRVNRVVTVRNNGSAPLVLSSVSGSCGCETVSLARSGVAVAQMALQPGEEAQVRISLNTRRVSGTFLKYVWVNSPGTSAPLATIELAGTARDLVRFMPRALSFGASPAGASRSLLVTAGVDAALLNGRPLPVLKSGNPAVEVVPEGEPRSAVHAGRPQVEQVYRVTLTAAAPGGTLFAILGFTGVTVTATDAEAVLASASLAVTAEVRNALTAAPSVVVFGAFAAGRPARRQVVLSAASLEQIQGLAFSSTSPHLSGVFSEPEVAGTGGRVYMRILTVTVLGTAPAGPITGQVTLSSPTGTKVTLSVVGEAVR